MGVVLNKFDKVVFLLDRFHLDIAMTVVSVFIIVVFISIMFETCMWSVEKNPYYLTQYFVTGFCGKCIEKKIEK